MEKERAEKEKYRQEKLAE